MRLFGILIRFLDALAVHFPGLSVHLALRNLSRQGMDYNYPLLIVMVSVALGVYTISMSASLDQWSEDRWRYLAGADLSFTPVPMSAGTYTEDGSWIPKPNELKN
jgi:hypothetical protein